MFTFPIDTNCSVCRYWKDWSLSNLRAQLTLRILSNVIKLVKIPQKFSVLHIVVVYRFQTSLIQFLIPSVV